jgi:hypothetical protein
MASTDTVMSPDATASSAQQLAGTSADITANLQQEIVELKAKLEGVTQSNKQSVDALEERLKLSEEFAKLREFVERVDLSEARLPEFYGFCFAHRAFWAKEIFLGRLH